MTDVPGAVRLHPARSNGNGERVETVPRFERVEPPSRRDLAIAAVLVAASATLVGLGLWKAAELVADAT